MAAYTSSASLVGAGSTAPHGVLRANGSAILQADAFGLWRGNAKWRDTGAALSAAGVLLANLANAVKSRKRLTRTLVSVPASAPSWANGLVAQINALFRSTPEPTSPTRLYDVATPSDLPPAYNYPLCLAWVDSRKAVVVSNGASWFSIPLGPAI